MNSRLALSLALVVPATAAPEAADFVPLGGAGYEIGGSSLIGQGPALEGFIGNWVEAFGGSESPGVVASGLIHPGTASAEGAFQFSGTGGGRTGRLLAQVYDEFSIDTVYFSVLIQLETVGSNYRAFELHSRGFDDELDRTLQIATGEEGSGPFDTSHFVVRLKGGANVQSADLGAGDTNVNLFVGRADLGAGVGLDTVTVWRNPDLLAEPGGGAVFTGADFRFDRVSLARFGESGITFDEIRFGATYADVTTVDHVAAADSDGDGMRDEWERENFLEVGVDDSAGNSDGDGLTNLEEFQNGTDPGSRDTDFDGLDDDVEVANGTDPRKADSDGDGIDDAEEGVPGADGFVTNPIVADTDGDGESDGFEVAQGTDPTDPDSNSQGVVVIDGFKDPSYGDALAVQSIETGFGNNQSEWNAAYGQFTEERLNLLFTGNLEANFNKLEIFIDAGDTGVSVFPDQPGNDGSAAMVGMTFDAEFTPEYHLIARRGDGKFDLDISRLATTRFDSYFDVFGGSTAGAATTGMGMVNRRAIGLAYDDSNVAGIGGTAGQAANRGAALAVDTGLELSIALSDLGRPAGDVRVMILQANQGHDFLSNQSLGGLPQSTGNLGNPGSINFNSIAGDQFFTVPRSVGGPELDLDIPGYNRTRRILFVEVGNIPIGQTFHLRSSTNGQSFAPLSPGIEFTSATPQPLEVPSDVAANLIQVFAGSSP